MVRTSFNQAIGAHRCLSRNIAGSTGMDGGVVESDGSVGVIGLGANLLPWSGPTAHSAAVQPRQRSAALDVSTSKSAVCVLNRQACSVVLETTADTDATAILAALKPYVV